MPAFRRATVTTRAQNNNSIGAQRSIYSCTPESSVNSNLSFGPPIGTLHSDPLIPKHISISYPSSDHALVYESVVLIFTISAFSLQLLHLYRTVWWLPQSYTQFALKFYLVNPYMIGYVLTLILPRWFWTLCKTLIDCTVPSNWINKIEYYLQNLIVGCFGLGHIYFASIIMYEEVSRDNFRLEMNHLRFFCLLYPGLILALTYQNDTRKYLDLIPGITGRDLRTPQNMDLQHNCASDPVKVRQEVDFLRNNFNSRLQNVLLHSYNAAVVTTLFPCCFVQDFIHFDLVVAAQHILLVWAGSFTLNAIHAFPPKYCDILHRAAKHLGCWDYVGAYSSVNAGVTCAEWCSRTVWKQGAIVRFDNEVYRARGDLNSAKPGTLHQERFYALFINAAFFQICLLVFQVSLILIQFILLLRSIEWYQMISLSLLQASGGYALFKLTRDSVVVWRLSLAEDMLKNA